jgi:hypothetical protein
MTHAFGGAVSALAGDEDVVAVVRGADADRLQAAVGADRVRELLELPIVADVAAWVERLGNGLSRGRRSDERPEPRAECDVRTSRVCAPRFGVGFAGQAGGWIPRRGCRREGRATRREA